MSEAITYARVPDRDAGLYGIPLDWHRLMIYDGDNVVNHVKEIDTEEGWYSQFVAVDPEKPMTGNNVVIQRRESKSLRIVRLPQYA